MDHTTINLFLLILGVLLAILNVALVGLSFKLYTEIAKQKTQIALHTKKVTK